MIRNLFAALMILQFTGVSYCQLKDGFYVSSDRGYNTQGKDFICVNGDEFKLLRITDVEDGYGEGFYQIINDTLHLRFSEKAQKPTFAIESLESAESDSVCFDFIVSDQRKGYGMMGVTLIHDNTKRSVLTDTEGYGQLKIATSELSENDFFKTSYVGYSEQKIPAQLHSGYHQKVKVELASGYYYFGENDLLVYPIKRDQRVFSLKIYEEYVVFSRTSKKKFNKAIKAFNALK